MSWRSDSSAGAFVWDTQPLTSDDLKLRDEEIAWLVEHERRDWRLINGRIARSGDPIMGVGVYGAPAAYSLPGALAGVALSATESALVSNTNAPTYVPIPGNSIKAPAAWRFMIAARYTVTTTPGSMITSFRLGNANSSPLLGTSAAVALTASLTNAFVRWRGDITIQSVGAPGANSKALGMFNVDVNTAVGGAANSALWGTSAGTAVAFDSTLASLGANGGALWVGVSDSGATNHATVTVDQIHWLMWD
jgi:hypothetical protein